MNRDVQAAAPLQALFTRGLHPLLIRPVIPPREGLAPSRGKWSCEFRKDVAMASGAIEVHHQSRHFACEQRRPHLRGEGSGHVEGTFVVGTVRRKQSLLPNEKRRDRRRDAPRGVLTA